MLPLSGAVLSLLALLMSREWCPRSDVTFDLYRAPPLVQGLLVCERWLGGVTPLTQEMGNVIVMGVWWNIVEVMVCPCRDNSLWAASGQSKFLGEWASSSNRMVLMWVCPGPSLPA